MSRTQTTAQQARNALGAAVRRGDPPEAIAAARRALDEANQATAVRELREWATRAAASLPPFAQDEIAAAAALAARLDQRLAAGRQAADGQATG